MQRYFGRLFAVQVGQTISVSGRVKNDPQRIDVELSQMNNDAEDVGNIQFHLSARFQPDDTSIVRNSHQKGEGWGVEERSENLLPFNDTANPIIKGGIFKISIFVDRDAFFVSIDEKPFCTFAHRHSITNIQRIILRGDIDEVFQVNQKTAQPNPWPIVNTNTFEAFAPGQFNPGNVILITGMPRGNSNGNFIVNFYDGANKVRKHFKLQAFLPSHEVTLNSQQENGEFGENVSFNYPFAVGEVFKLAIAISDKEYHIAINGQKFSSMTFRDEINRLFGSLTGIEIISNDGLNIQVQGVDYLRLRPDCTGFERF